MPKAIAHPTDSRLLERCREHLVKAAARHGLKLRQNYNREAPLQTGPGSNGPPLPYVREQFLTTMVWIANDTAMIRGAKLVASFGKEITRPADGLRLDIPPDRWSENRCPS